MKIFNVYKHFIDVIAFVIHHITIATNGSYNFLRCIIVNKHIQRANGNVDNKDFVVL